MYKFLQVNTLRKQVLNNSTDGHSTELGLAWVDSMTTYIDQLNILVYNMATYIEMVNNILHTITLLMLSTIVSNIFTSCWWGFTLSLSRRFASFYLDLEQRESSWLFNMLCLNCLHLTFKPYLSSDSHSRKYEKQQRWKPIIFKYLYEYTNLVNVIKAVHS